MLNNKFSPLAFQQYKKAYLKNFLEDSEDCFNFTVDHYINSDQIFITENNEGNFELGMMVLPKKIISNNQEYSAGLIYGLVASDQARGTGILAKHFPMFLDLLRRKYDAVIIQSDHWKIYKDYPFIDVGESVIYKNKTPFIKLANIYEDYSGDLAASMVSIYGRYLENFNIKNYVAYDLLSLSKFLKLAFLNDENVYMVPGAYAIYDRKTHECNSVVFESYDCLKNLLSQIPEGSNVVISKLFDVSGFENLSQVEQYVYTKQLKNDEINLFPLLFNELN
ncbi:hypothetical protein [[Mycoplasma] testudinis]|uniref:hypothetical protein n=1 Tax=[Mycoplasma] testudinis TaxID=33924 RepID=UPI000487702D|nr:hypothetical protein [[Mycoplasma] testudinis]